VAYLLDTNILLRIAQPRHPAHQEARECVRALLRKKQAVVLVPQVLVEFWVVATRPVANNGLGFSIEDARRKIEAAQDFFPLALDTNTLFREWLRLIEVYRVSGVSAHDARIVAAAMRTHSIQNLVTLDSSDFKRFDGTEITVLTPDQITRAYAN
jgi:predicted nucleic acid-binding protein